MPVPVTNSHRGHGWHGNLVLVREGAVRGLRQIRLPGLEPRGALVADLDLTAGPVRVVAAHLGLLRQSRLLQVEALLEHAGETTDRPVVLMGDLNEWRLRRRSALHGFTPVLRAARAGVPSFPAYFPVLALDRVLARPHGLMLEPRGARVAAVAARVRPPAGRAVVRLGRRGPDGGRAAPGGPPHRRGGGCSAGCAARGKAGRHEAAARWPSPPRSLRPAGRPGRWPSRQADRTATA